MPFTPAHPNEINFGWLLRLRWWMIAGQLVAILGVRVVLGLSLPLAGLLTIIGVEAASNVVASVAASRGRRQPREWWLAGIMAFDIAMCTGLLYLTGGPSNPFSFLYLVQIALAAITLRAAWTWALTALALLGSAVLFRWHRPFAPDVSHERYMDMHLHGMWVAFGVAASFIVYFLLRVRSALEVREAELAASRRATARQERLASLATLAAGAAHELSTPLATIAVVMKELEHSMAGGAPANRGGDAGGGEDSNRGDEALQDIRLVREQVDRCRAILEQMSSEAGTSVGEAFLDTSLESIVAMALVGLSPRVPIHTKVSGADDQAHDEDRRQRVRIPRRAFSQAISAIIKNAQDASGEGEAVVLLSGATAAGVMFEVTDRGRGIAPAILDRIGEPFFTTKPPGQGMGLGLFLARAVVERLGGHVQLTSTVGVGTVVTVHLPPDAVVGRAEPGVNVA